MKGYVARHNKSFTMAEMKQLFLDAVQEITPDVWSKCVEHVIQKIEVDMWKLDKMADELEVAPLVIEFTESDLEDKQDPMDFGF